MLENYKSQPVQYDDESVLQSATDLFYYYRQAFTNFAGFSTGKPFLDLCRLFGKWLKFYADFLNQKLPKYIF
jgi:hypothetical protein